MSDKDRKLTLEKTTITSDQLNDINIEIEAPIPTVRNNKTDIELDLSI